ncbi:AMP-binding protein [Massilia solisilvae]|uniref:AMP-binding protein n=1 Tax=Massilia solisilvae TaxID=1811225 RepID=A0ABT2BN91_9BURK|nr:AMP-binding protein [Massilia solisilvae]MCS0609950.1 AMP-binding protein [Massilia solisilvae]
MQPGLLAGVRRLAAETPDRIALTFLDDDGGAPRTLTFGQIDNESRRIARRLLRHCPDAQRALLLHRPGPEFVTALCACWVAGITPVPTYPPTYRLGSRASERFERLVADADAQLALVDSASLARTWQAGHDAGALHWLATDETHPDDDAGAQSKPGTGPALIQYTSGSTGSPRGVCLSQANLEANLATMADRFALPPSACVVSWLPPYHDMGLIGGILPMLAFGVHLVLMTPAHFIARPRRWLEAISRYRASHSGGPNFAYELCAQKLAPQDLAGLDLSSWRVAFCGAETVRAASLQRFAALAASAGFSADALAPCYGLAESTLLVSARAPGSGLATHARDEEGETAQQRVSCGAPGPGVRVAIVDERARRCPERSVGEIWIAGAQVAAGYWRQDRLNAQVFGQALQGEPGAWLRSGDTGYLHDGELYVTGRIKDLIILRGRNCYPADIEQLAGASHPALDPLAVAAFSDEGAHGERLVVACELRRERRRADQQQVARAIQAALAQALDVSADEIVLLLPGALPRTTSGKISRSGTRAAWRSGELALAPATPAPARAAGQAALLDCAARLAGLDPGQVDSDWTLGELGIDSLKRVELTITLEQELGRAIGVEQLRPDLPLRELQRLLDAAPSGPADAAGGAGQAAVYVPSPVQLRLLTAGVADPNDFLEIVYLRAPAALDQAALEAALAWLAQRHPALRLRFERAGGAGWSARPDGAGIGLERLDMAAVPAGAHGWQNAVLQQLRAAIDIERGHLAHAVWLDRGAGETGVLALALHHLAIDAVSVAILLRGLQHAYGQACRGTLAPPAPDAFLDWLGERQERTATPGWAEDEVRFWRAVCGTAGPPVAQPWPFVFEHTAQQRLAPLANRRFLERFADGPARHDALLAAFCHAWCSASGDASALVLLNQHGRSGASAAAVGWLVDFYPVRVEAAPSSPQRQYAAARQAHAAVAPHAADYALLCHGAAGHAQAKRLAQPALALEFRGAVDNGFRRDGVFTFLGATHLPGAWNEARARSGSFPALELSASMGDGTLAWRLCYLPHAVARDKAEAIGAAVARFLERLLED